MNSYSIQTSVFAPGQDLRAFIRAHVPTLSEGSILLVASKLFALAQGRVVPQEGVNKDALIAQESTRVFPIVPGLALTYKDGHWCPNAGIDASNAFGQYVLWPLHPMEEAQALCEWMRSTYGVQRCGIVMTDSRVFPARHGVTAFALGYAGFLALKDYRGKADLAGRPMEYTVVNVADCLATTGAFLMGEGSESQPLALIEGAPVEFVAGSLHEELCMDPKKDLFRALWS